MGTARVVELERKYDVKESAVLPRLQDLAGVRSVDPPLEQLLVAEYFDTRDLRLLAHGITLRRRTGGDDAGWHLKLPVAVSARHEHREPLGREPDTIPESLLDLIRVHTRDRKLGHVARITTHRTLHRLRGKNKGVLAEVCDDLVEATTLTGQHEMRRWREWEVELIDGDKDIFDAGDKVLAATGIRPSRYLSKLARALGSKPRTPNGPVRATKNDTAGRVLLVYLGEQVRELKDQDPQVRSDAKDSVHKMRVATRRMRSVLATYRKLFRDRDGVQFVRDELKWLAGVLGGARDAEVMHARLKSMTADEPADLILGPVTRRVDIELGAEYEKAHTKVLKALNGQRYFRLLDTLDSLIAEPALAPVAGKPAATVIPKLIGKDVKRLRLAVKEARDNPAGITDHPALHEARKDGKRLRYAAEAALPIAPKKAAKLADTAHEVQKILGDHQDSIVTRKLLRRLGAESFLQGENGFSYGRLHALEQTAALQTEAAFHREWKKFPALKL
ncbi:CHAD domain-containing protein [Paenarthrobacter sp. NPDC089989]|uniref:CYTH and CHAD domain-containing protein n=1 Tax=unclassified Paenarthrobacter TaxID=2634190 RepID=UPI00381B5F47